MHICLRSHASCVENADLHSSDPVMCLRMTLDSMVMVLPVCSPAKWTVTRTGGRISVGEFDLLGSLSETLVSRTTYFFYFFLGFWELTV